MNSLIQLKQLVTDQIPTIKLINYLVIEMKSCNLCYWKWMIDRNRTNKKLGNNIAK